MAVQRILRLRRTDQTTEHLLVNITQEGARPLDLKLVATDQEHLFHQSFSEASIKSLQTAQFNGSLPEWESILSYVLLRERPNGPLPELLRGLEPVASISGNSVNLTIRKNIDGITQRLGVITLDQDDEREEIAAFDWVDAAVASSDELRTQVEELQSALASHKEQMTTLTRQLDELVEAKKEHENELLSKFAAVLNSKKLKIRDQQRLLAGAKIDPKSAEAVEKARFAEKHRSRKPDTSRSGKRRAGTGVEEDDVSDDAKERVLGTHGSSGRSETDADDDDDSRLRQETPQASDEEATEGEEADGGDIPLPSSSRSARTTTTGRTRLTEDMKFTKNSQPGADTRDVDRRIEIPPRRELPFARRAGVREQPPQETAPAEDDPEDDETDDEL